MAKPNPDHPVWLSTALVQRTEASTSMEWRFAVRAATWRTAQQKVLKLAQRRYRNRFGNWDQPHVIAVGALLKFDAVE